MKYTTVSVYLNGKEYRSKNDFDRINDARAYAAKSMKRNRHIIDVLIMRYSGNRRKDGSLIDKSPVGFVAQGSDSKGNHLWLYTVWGSQKNGMLVINEDGSTQKYKKVNGKWKRKE